MMTGIENASLTNAEKADHRSLMSLVKADDVGAVERFFEDRDDALRLLNAKPTGCLLLEEAVSGRMVVLLKGILDSAEKERTAAECPPARPNVHGAWATQGAL